MKLYIAEKPSLGKTVANVLGGGKPINGGIAGDGWVMTWCFGHLYEQYQPEDYNDSWVKWNSSDLPMIPEQWKISPKSDAKKQISIISKLLSTANSVVNVGDPDREGQLLVDEVLKECNWNGTTDRLWLPDLTDKGITKSLSNIKSNSDYQGLYDAAVARQRADWLVGMNLTRAYTINARKGGHDGVLSVGRVQTPTLALVVNRDETIANFKSIDFYELSGEFDHQNGQYTGKLIIDESKTDDEGRLIDLEIANKLKAAASVDLSATISDVDKKTKTNYPPLCLSLTDLQALGSKRFGMSADKVLTIAQSLYETYKITTYPRSESGYLTENQFDDVPGIIVSLKNDSELATTITGADLSLKSKVWNDKKSSEAAHTAIIPTGDSSKLSSLNEEELSIFRLIAERYIIQFYKPNVIEQTTFNTNLSDSIFKSSGNVTIVDGWKSVYSDEDEVTDESVLIDVNNADTATLLSIDTITKSTTPPKPFNDGTLVVAMKNISKYIDGKDAKETLRDVKGIGTVATRAKIIENLKKRGFLTNKGRALVSTPQAQQFVGFLPDAIKSAVTTADWEQMLAKVEAGSLSLNEFTQAQIDNVNKLLAAVSDVQIAPSKDAITCPECGTGILNKRKGKYGAFWGCSRYSDGCKAIYKDNRNKPILEKKETPTFPESPCSHPDCSGTAKQFSKKKGKGKFWICNDCDKSGRNKFLSDKKGSPVLQD